MTQTEQGQLREDPDAEHPVVDGVQLREDEPLPDRPAQGQVRHLLRHALQRLRLHKGTTDFIRKKSTNNSVVKHCLLLKYFQNIWFPFIT